MGNAEKHFYEFGEFRLDTGERVLLRGGERVRLRGKLFDTLAVLVGGGGRLMEKDELMGAIWPGTFVNENGLARNVSELRRLLGDDPDGNLFIETVPGHGYRFIAPVRELKGEPEPPEPHAPDAPASPPDAASVEGASSASRVGSGWRRPALVALAVLLVAGCSLYYLTRRRARAPGPGFRSIAVLPFKPLGASGGEDEYLRLGLADALITKLSNVRQIAVRPTSAVRKYASAEQDPLAAGRELGVEAVLEGSLQREGERVKVNVQLLSVGDGRAVWGETFNEPFTGIFDVQDRIAALVTDALRAQVTAAERERVMRRYTENAAAYELYLQGRARLARYTNDETRAAVKSFEDALRLDERNALAHAGLAEACALVRIRYASEAEYRDWEGRAKREAARALELDPGLAQAHEALASIYRNTEFDWEHTVAESDRALELNPNLEQPHLYRAAAFYHLGLFDDAEREVRAAAEINPANRVEPFRLRGTTALLGGKFSEAAALLEEAQRLSEATTTGWYLSQAYYYAGERERAETMLADLHGGAQVEQRAAATLASFLAARGERARAEELLRKVSERTYMDHHVAYAVGAARAQLGDHAEALKWLARAAATGLPCYPWYERDPLLAPLRGDPEFQQFMAGLRSSWEAGQKR